MVTQPGAVIVAGPTASGKSALALAIARRFGGTVINADSMQVYAELPIVTAQPSAADRAAAPHALYGVRPAALAASVAWWRDAALDAMAASPGLPILCGGTGMYLNALTQGVSALPDVPKDARAASRALLAAAGPAAVHARLDAETAATLQPGDSQRVARAYEVLLGTGRGLVAWQREAPLLPPAPYRFTAIVLDPERAALRAAIAMRFAAMLDSGALAEVAALLARGLDPALPAMRAHGVPELAAHLRGEWPLAEATRRAALVTGQYTKRQATWFRHHALAPPERSLRIAARYGDFTQSSESNREKIFAFLRGSVDAPQQGV